MAHEWIGISLLIAGAIFVQLSEVNDIRGKEIVNESMRTIGIITITCAALTSACAGY